MLTEDQYIQAGGNRCPHCASEDIESWDLPIVEGATATQKIGCNSCNKEWVDQYQLVGFETIPTK